MKKIGDRCGLLNTLFRPSRYFLGMTTANNYCSCSPPFNNNVRTRSSPPFYRGRLHKHDQLITGTGAWAVHLVESADALIFTGIAARFKPTTCLNGTHCIGGLGFPRTLSLRCTSRRRNYERCRFFACRMPACFCPVWGWAHRGEYATSFEMYTDRPPCRYSQQALCSSLQCPAYRK